MITQQMSDEVCKAVKDLGKYRRADGVVMTKIDLHDVVDAIAEGHSIELHFLRVLAGYQLVESDEGLQAIAGCVIEAMDFGDIRDLAIQAGARGVFEFTAKYSTVSPRSIDDVTRCDFRFHVNNVGQATFVVLDK